MRPPRPSLRTFDPAASAHARARGAWLALASQLTAAALAYALQIVLARALGTAGFGVYATALAWIAPLSVLAGCGLPAVALRFLPAYRADGDHERAAAFVRAAEHIALASSAALAGLGTVLALIFARDPLPLVVALWTLPLTVQLRLHTEIARAAGRFREAFVMPLLQPLTMLVAALLAREVFGELTPALGLCLPVLGVLAVLPWQRSVARRLAPRTRAEENTWSQRAKEDRRGGWSRARPRSDTHLWLRVGLGVLLVDAAFLLLAHADAVLIGALVGARGAALFSVATGTAALAMFPMIAVGSTAVPAFSRLWALGRKDELERVARHAVLRAFTAQIAIAILLVAAARPILALSGADFEEARVPLLLVLLGQLANTGTGYVGSIANMTGHQATVLRPLWWVAAAHVALVVLGLHVAGLTGAAAATALSSLAWNLWVYRIVRRHLGLRVSFIDALGAAPSPV